MYRAIHIAAEDGLFVSSAEVTSRDPEKVADQLAKEFGDYPERIILLGNADQLGGAPVVIEDWSHGEDYQTTK